MALLTPLNVNCHASDGRKVGALTRSAPIFGRFGLFSLEIEGKCSFWAFVRKQLRSAEPGLGPQTVGKVSF